MTKTRWVFGYGSLMWRPGFPFLEKREAVLHGYHRAFCVYSHVHRGTPERPGLVLGLDRGGSCRGMAFRVGDEAWDGVVDYLRAREQVTAIYVEAEKTVRFAPAEGLLRETARVLCYLADPAHHQYAGKLTPEEQVPFILQGHGRSGDNVGYLENTLDHLAGMRLARGPLERVRRLVRAQRAGAAA